MEVVVVVMVEGSARVPVRARCCGELGMQAPVLPWCGERVCCVLARQRHGTKWGYAGGQLPVLAEPAQVHMRLWRGVSAGPVEARLGSS